MPRHELTYEAAPLRCAKFVVVEDTAIIEKDNRELVRG
jgi:hypothetical protein